MGFRYFIKEHVGKCMMVQMLQYGILESNHLLFDELLKRKKTHKYGVVEDHIALKYCWKGKALLLTQIKVSRRDVG
jgi:mannitol/fructose-specific phosphotransferase system IIA component (Ntr-type)